MYHAVDQHQSTCALKVKKDLKQHCQDFYALARELGVDVESCNLDVWTSEVRDHAKQLDRNSSSEDGAAIQKSFELHQKIGYMASSINQRLKNINRLADTSKQGHRLRKKITDEKSDLARLISEYNGLTTCYIRVSMDIAGLAAKPKDVLDSLDLTTLGVNSSCIFESVPFQLKTSRHYTTTDCKVEIADALDNNFPWALHDQTGEMPLRTKKQVVEKYLEGRRLTEEKLLLEKEMTGFLKFYKDTVIPEILSTIESLKAVFSECNEDCSLDEASGPVSSSEGSSEGRYCYEGTESLAVRGKISLARKGLDFAKAQIAQGVAMFKAATKGDSSEFEFADSNNQHFGDDDEESTSSEPEWDDIGAELGDDIVTEPSRQVEPVSLVDGDVYSWMFPPEFCQTSIDGRNGSNACSLISLAVAHTFLTVDISLPLANLTCPQIGQSFFTCACVLETCCMTIPVIHCHMDT